MRIEQSAPDERPRQQIGVHRLAVLLDDWRSGTTGTTNSGYLALADRLRLLILDGRLPVHTRLPSERALAEAISTSRTTTTAAYRVLRERGFARAGQGAGTWTTLPRDADSSPGERVPWPVATSGERGGADGRGDLSSAAMEAPSQVHAAYATALSELPRYLPGHGYVTAGLPALRAQIAARFTARGLATAPEEVLVTAGAMHGLRLVLEALLAPGDRVLAEHPTYPLALDAIRRAGGRPVGLEVETGWDVDRARDVVRTSGARLAYLMPDFQNPTGNVMPASTRAQFARMFADAGCTAVIDETTADLDLRAHLGAASGGTAGLAEAAALPFAAYAHRAVTLGSASKTFWGGLRIGWVRADRALIQRLMIARAGDDLGSPILEQLATARLFDVLDDVLTSRRVALAARCRALQSALAGRLPQWRAPDPCGGMVLWCTLPEQRSTALAGAARSLGMIVAPGPRFGVDGGFENRVRLPFTRPESDLVAAAELLAAAWRDATGAAVERAPGADSLAVV